MTKSPTDKIILFGHVPENDKIILGWGTIFELFCNWRRTFTGEDIEHFVKSKGRVMHCPLMKEPGYEEVDKSVYNTPYLTTLLYSWPLTFMKVDEAIQRRCKFSPHLRTSVDWLISSVSLITTMSNLFCFLNSVVETVIIRIILAQK